MTSDLALVSPPSLFIGSQIVIYSRVTERYTNVIRTVHEQTLKDVINSGAFNYPPIHALRPLNKLLLKISKI